VGLSFESNEIDSKTFNLTLVFALVLKELC
jgi:hypothetical protein